jgi:hypothetical protein
MKGRELDKYQTRGESRDESHHGSRYGDPERYHPISSACPWQLLGRQDRGTAAKPPWVAGCMWDRGRIKSQLCYVR